ncbi:MAG TPA: PAS domain-containing protein [Alphaproteobacteria bacterium]|nr:PAS domain-containing protein [Alphaproteobacteria bacterium]
MVSAPDPLNETRRRIGDGRMVEVYDYWSEKRGVKKMPSATEIDLLDLPTQLPNLFVVDVEDAPRRYRYRVVGTNLTETLAEDIAGRYLDEMPWLFRRYAEPAYAELLAAAAPQYKEIRIFRSLWRARYRRLLLPLGEPDKPIDMVLGCIYRF